MDKMRAFMQLVWIEAFFIFCIDLFWFVESARHSVNIDSDNKDLQINNSTKNFERLHFSERLSASVELEKNTNTTHSNWHQNSIEYRSASWHWKWAVNCCGSSSCSRVCNSSLRSMRMHSTTNVHIWESVLCARDGILGSFISFLAVSDLSILWSTVFYDINLF